MEITLLHGLGQDASSWDRVAAQLSGQMEVHSPALYSLWGEGEKNYLNLSRGWDAWADRREEPLHLCGLSLGAILALDYALRHPQRVQSLVLVAPQSALPKALVWFQNIVFRCMPESSFSGLGMKKQEVITLMRSTGAINFTSQLAQISCPVLILCGEKDKANLGMAQKMAKQIPSAQFQVIPEAAHEVNVDAPEALAKAILSFYQ